MFGTTVKKVNKSKQIRRALEMVAILILALYPLRHIHVGLDLWDTGYNYANFEYMGLKSMDSMWLFSTYLSNTVGHLLTLLPFGKTLLGLNFYTSLTVSLIAVISYVFCTGHLKYSKPAVFVAEFTAISLCWCPTALLYNYLTYFLMLLAVIGLYVGLSRSKRRFLFASGTCLGLNVFVRFSNLPEVLFIFVVWGYCILEAISESREEKSDALRKRDRADILKRSGIRTIWCILGYIAAVAVVLGFISLRYGFLEYVSGIRRLFGMQEVATGYSAKSMIMSVLNTYIVNSYWLLRVSFFAVCGVLAVAVGKFMDARLDIAIVPRGVFGKKFSFTGLGYFAAVIAAGGCVYWLLIANFSDGDHASYNAIIRPAVFLLSVMVIWAAVVIFLPGENINNKLMAGIVIIVIMVTPIGSNNGLFPAFNNLFIALPWFAHRVYKLLRKSEKPGYAFKRLPEKYKDKRRIVRILTVIKSYFSFFPIKMVVISVLLLNLVVFTLFGYGFTFAEAKNAENPHFKITAGKTLEGIRMSEEKAVQMLGLTHFVEANGFKDLDLLTYGYIPSLSFYLQMPSAFNPWVDLPSYRFDVMKGKIEEIINRGDEADLPLIITDVSYAKYADGENDEEDYKEITDDKWLLIMKLIEARDYEIVYRNEKFAVFYAHN